MLRKDKEIYPFLTLIRGAKMIKNANWIKPVINMKNIAPLFKREFDVKKEVKKATLTITAMGVYDAFLNGEKIGNYIMAPGWTVYEKRHQYQSYDIKDMIREQNCLTVLVAAGWYRSKMPGWDVKKLRTNYLLPPAIIGEIEIEYADGEIETIITDLEWKVSESPLLYCTIYDGEIYDANHTANKFGDVEFIETDKSVLIPQEGEIIREQERIKPASFFVTPNGEKVLDFGQNITGYVEFTVNAKIGDKVLLTCAEILDKDGNVYNINYRSAKSQIEYYCITGVQTHKPSLTFYGFRYIHIDEFPNEVNPDDFTAIVVHSDMKRTGKISCGKPILNRFFKNARWGQKDNYLDVPTDCPQRDERLGWTGDAQVFIKAAAYQYDIEKFFEKWLKDLAADQAESGKVGMVIPDVIFDDFISAAWGDAACVCPWELYKAYGNPQILENQFESMKKWVDYIGTVTKDEYLWIGGFHCGDWLALDVEDKRNCFGGSDRDLIASVYYFYSTQILVKAGYVLERDVSKYEELEQRIHEKLKKMYATYKTQTEHILALHFDFTPDREKTIADLVKMIQDNGDCLTTGFVGTPLILHVLSDNGYADLAYTLLLQERFPSWLFSVKMGATTIWERWDCLEEDGSPNKQGMVSYNHYAYGSVMDWVYGVAAGIKPIEEFAGYKKISIAPVPDKRIGWIDAELETRCGKVRSMWWYDGDSVRYEIETPAPAVITINDKIYEVEKGTYMF